MSTKDLAEILKPNGSAEILRPNGSWIADSVEAKDAVASVMRLMKEVEAERGNPLKISLRAICDACDFSTTLVKEILTGLGKFEAIDLPKSWQHGNIGNVREITISFDDLDIEKHSLSVAYTEFRYTGKKYKTPTGRDLRLTNLTWAAKIEAEDAERYRQQVLVNEERARKDRVRFGECAAIAKHRADGKCGACGNQADKLYAHVRLYLTEYRLQLGVRDPSWLIALCENCYAIVRACHEEDLHSKPDGEVLFPYDKD